MSEALTRVIDNQQQEIDGHRETIVSLQKQLIHLSEERDEMFSLVKRLFFDNRVRFDSEPDREKYINDRENLRHFMMDQGWCFTCSQLYCDGHYDD